MAIRIADLFVGLRADDRDLRKKLKGTKGAAQKWGLDLDKIARQASTLFVGVAASVTGVGAALTATFAVQSASIDKLAKDSRKLGIATGQFQALQLAGELSGISSDKLAISVQRMTRRVSEAAQGLGEARGAIAELGLDADNLAKLTPDQIFRKIVTELEKIPDAKDRVRLAFKFFDSEGVDIVNVTTAAIETANTALDSMGAKLSSIDTFQVERARDSLTLLGVVADTVGKQITVKLAGPIADIATSMFEAVTQTSGFEKQLDGLIKSALGGLAALTGSMASVLNFVDDRPEIGTFGIIGYLLYGKRGFALGAAIGTSAGLIKDTVDSLFIGLTEGTTDNVNFIQAEIDRLKSKLGVRNLPLVGNLFGDDQNIKDRIRGLEFQLSIQRQLAAISGDTEESIEETTTLTSGLAGALQLVSDNLTKTLEGYGKLPEAAANAAAYAAGGDVLGNVGNGAPAINDSYFGTGDDQLFSDQRVDIERDTADLIATLEAERLEESRKRHNSYFSSIIATQKQFQNTWTLFQESGAKARTQIFYNETLGALGILAQHSKTFFKINKAAGIANAIVNVAQGVTEALKLPFPASLAAAAKVALEGAVAIKSITTAQFGGTPTPVTITGNSGVGSTGGLGTNPIASNDGQVDEGGGTHITQYIITGDPSLVDKERFKEYTSEAMEAATRSKELIFDTARSQFTRTTEAA